MTPLYGQDLFGNPITPETSGKLADDFIVPPFSVLNAREGAWQDRKRAWLSFGIKSEIGRAGDLLQTGANSAYGGNGFAGNRGGVSGNGADPQSSSVFDPVLCELAYRWFSPPNGQIVDPFAGGSVRGIVAHSLGRQYWGCDLRSEQVAANVQQGHDILLSGTQPTWICGDALDVLPSAPEADFVFSCPPYGDLEQYSDDPRDLSAMTHDAFRLAYYKIIKLACSRLKPNRFACFVVADFRDKAGYYRNFLCNTIASFEAGGCRLYNEIVLLTAVGSLPVRAGKQFRAGRKVGKAHQNVLVFVKGEGRAAADACGTIAADYEFF